MISSKPQRLLCSLVSVLRKTTTAGKIGGIPSQTRWHPMLVAADVYPAAITQLQSCR